MSAKKETFEQWCIVEVMGKQVLAGKVTEQVIGGCSFIRVDVPEMDGQDAFTRFYGQSAIYAMTPVSEEVAKIVLKRVQPSPVNVWVPELKQLAAPSPSSSREVIELEDDDDDDWEDDFNDEEEPF